MRKIGQIKPVKEMGTIPQICKSGIKRIARSVLPKDCYWREGKVVRAEALKFIQELLKEEKEIDTDLVCFFCSVQQTQFYENCRGKHPPKIQ